MIVKTTKHQEELKLLVRTVLENQLQKKFVNGIFSHKWLVALLDCKILPILFCHGFALFGLKQNDAQFCG